MKRLVGLLLLAGCAGQGPQTAYPGQYLAEHGPSALSAAPRTLIEIRPFADVPDVPPGHIGDVRDAKGAVIQSLDIAPPPGRQFSEALGAELQAAGHMVTGPGAAAVLEGGVQRFAFAGTPDKVTWDTKIQAQLAIKISYRGRSVSRAYTATCNDAGLLRPTADGVAEIAKTCITNIARQFRNDPGVAGVLAGN